MTSILKLTRRAILAILIVQHCTLVNPPHRKAHCSPLVDWLWNRDFLSWRSGDHGKIDGRFQPIDCFGDKLVGILFKVIHREDEPLEFGSEEEQFVAHFGIVRVLSHVLLHLLHFISHLIVLGLAPRVLADLTVPDLLGDVVENIAAIVALVELGQLAQNKLHFGTLKGRVVHLIWDWFHHHAFTVLVVCLVMLEVVNG